VGELPPHSWFDEGHGDYFSGAVVRDGKVQRIGVNPWRIRLAKYIVQSRMHVRWKDILQYEHKQYYANAAMCYAEGWSMIYFLRTSKEVAKREAWAKILPTYFETLKSAWSEELAKLEAMGKKDDKSARAEAGLAARRVALDRAFTGVDIDEIEGAWLNFVEKLEDPEHK
jgi:hypothetical protein